MKKFALLFPGQGVQKVGMGWDFYEESPAARRIFEIADGVFPGILDLIFHGPEEELKRTSITQPAVFVCSVAVLEAAKENFGEIIPMVSAGHSLGEYSALYAADVFSFEDGLKLVMERGRFMEEASEKTPGGMAAIIGAERELVETVCRELSSDERVVVPANFNSPTQIVISGEKNLVKEAMKILKDRGAKRVVELKVGGAFHSPYMEEAAEKFKGALEKTPMKEARFPVISNVDAMPHTSPDEIKKLLYLQIKSPVEWVKSVEKMVEMGVETSLELGPGSVVSGLVKSTTKSIKTVTVSGFKNLALLKEVLG